MSTSTPVASPVKPSLDTDELKEYSRVAAEIGLLTNGSLMNERIMHCLQQNNISVFDIVQVGKFLNEKLGKDKWEWRGLRQSDVDEFIDSHGVPWLVHHGDDRVPFGKTTYSKKIPLPVLLTIQTILKDVPEAHFYISHPRETGLDPFLMVTVKGSRCFIVERWDEPDFRENP